MPFQTNPGTPYVLPDFTLGLPTVGDWPKWTGEVPWVLDPAKHPRPAIQSHHKSASPSSGDERWKRRKKKKHHQPKKQELKVTTRGQADNVPMWTHTGSNLSSSSESQTKGDSSIGSYWKPPGSAGSITQRDHTPRYSPETVRKLDKGDLEDAPLSDHGGNNGRDQEMVSGDKGGKEAMGTNPIWPTRPVATVTGLAVNLVVAPEAPEGREAPLLVDPADTDDEKACWDAFQLIMQGFHATTRTLSDGYQQACKEVQNIVRRSMK